MHTIALNVICVVAVGTYFLQLWTGFAVMGWTDKSIVSRENSPGPYWAVMMLQTTIGVFFGWVIFTRGI